MNANQEMKNLSTKEKHHFNVWGITITKHMKHDAQTIESCLKWGLNVSSIRVSAYVKLGLFNPDFDPSEYPPELFI